MRIGIYGGSFNPIHFGHLIVAENCREAVRLDRVKFLVANVSPFKQGEPSADTKQRVEMVRLAISGNSAFEVDDREIRAGGVSYTIDSLRAIQSENVEAELFLILGADSLIDFDRWKSPEEILSIATPIVVARGGVGEPNWNSIKPLMTPDALQRAIDLKVECPQIEIASRTIRHRVRDGKSIRYQLPNSVEAYIREHHLFLVNEISQ